MKTDKHQSDNLINSLMIHDGIAKLDRELACKRNKML